MPRDTLLTCLGFREQALVRPHAEQTVRHPRSVGLSLTWLFAIIVFTGAVSSDVVVGEEQVVVLTASSSVH